MIVRIEEVAKYLRIELDDLEQDDIDELEGLILAHETSLFNKTGVKFSSDNPLAKLFMKMSVADSFDNRTVKQKTSERISFTIEDILFQLRTCYDPSAEEVQKDATR